MTDTSTYDHAKLRAEAYVEAAVDSMIDWYKAECGGELELLTCAPDSEIASNPIVKAQLERRGVKVVVRESPAVWDQQGGSA